jgi:hypothetical protein
MRAVEEAAKARGGTTVPEPGTLAMFGTMLVALGGTSYVTRRRREDEV